MLTTVSIRENIEIVKERIESACLRSGRRPDEVRLVVATKTIPPEIIREAVDAGAEILGENYAQEAKEKIGSLGRNDIEWHLIGHLQRNKVRDAVKYFDLIQSLDSIRLAEEIDRRAKAVGKKEKVLIQVNLSGEESKSGVRKEDVIKLVSEVSRLNNLSLEGLMTLPPYLEDPEDVRPYFSALRALRERLEKEEGLHLKELSMGMSHDFETAIEEGTTMVRIGSAIFGQRRY